MTMLFATKNHATQTVHECPEPWAFKPTETITDELRHSKSARQNWYRLPATAHNFFTGVEGTNPNVRVSKNNPPHAFHAFIADFDIHVAPEKIKYAVEEMRVKPAWVGTSLGGGLHVIWLLEKPIVMRGDWQLATEVLDKASHWLETDLLPSLDKPAFISPSRYYCNGCEWKSTGFGVIPAAASQAFFFSVAVGMNRSSSRFGDIPIDVLEKALHDNYPNFNWPEAFAFNTQGPSFWVEGSTSPRSAVVKKDGMFTFAAHATQPFYSWSELLGNEFVRAYREKNLGEATAGIHFDGLHYWRKVDGIWRSCSKPEMELEFKVTYHLSGRGENGEPSQIEQCFSFIHNRQRVDSVGPHVLYPEGVISFHARRVLNTASCPIVQPAEGKFTWGLDFGFLAQLLDNLFEPSSQLTHFLAWWKYFYECALKQQPEPGQNAFFMGGTGVGKTYTSRDVFARAFGGGIDASAYLLEGSNFNSEFMEHAVWCVDDDTVSEDPRKQAKFAVTLKKCTANTDHNYNRKFEVGGSVQWTGRILCTSNLDAISSQILGPLDQSIKDKTSLYRCSHEPRFVFPSRDEVRRRTTEELPKLLRWLLDWVVPDTVERDTRFGVKSYHDSSLLAMSLQNSPASYLKEVLLQVFACYFQMNPDAKTWTGSMHGLLTLILTTNPVAGESLRKISHGSFMRYLALIEKEEAIRIEISIARHNVKTFTFHREDYV